MRIHRNAGMASLRSEKSIFVIVAVIDNPTKMSMAPVAGEGIDRKNGENNNASAKQAAVVRDVSPERPPCEMPLALSTKTVTVLVPNMAPQVVPIASAMNASFSRGIFPLTVIPALLKTPIIVPMVSNMSINRNVKTTTTIFIENISEKSN